MMSNSLRKFSRKRKRKTIVVKPIVFGNISFYRGKKVEGKDDHVWCCYVRSAEKDGDEFKPLSNYVRKVVFTLHESFKEYIMEVEKPPFSIVRNGWGEFDIKISIYFQDINEEPVVKNSQHSDLSQQSESEGYN